ncbi:MAG: minor capsid protein [Thermoanaerobacter sp.]|nr:minor capsid protein [Thermoanaerobacter sp.]
MPNIIESIKSRLGGITRLFASRQPASETITRRQDYSTLASLAESESVFDYDVFRLEHDRRSILLDVRQMLKEDPRVAEANRRLAQDACRGGITVVVQGASKDVRARNKRRHPGQKPLRRNSLADRAQEIIDGVIKTARINAKLSSWARSLLADGDLFLNVIVDLKTRRIVDIRRVPAITMKRNVDKEGRFVDISRAFSQLDPMVHAASFFPGVPENAIRHFALWEINHIRWNYVDGQIYGESQYAVIRRLSRQLLMTEEDLVVRRRTRAVQRRHHRIGTPERPGTPADVEAYKQLNSLDHQRGRFKQTTDYFSNGLVEIKNLEGDARLNEIEDIQYLLNIEFLRLGVPKGLLGFAEDINRDVLDEQQQQYLASLEHLTDTLEYGDPGAYSGLRAIFDFALLLQGINPDAVTYNIRWSEKTTEKLSERITRTIKARNAGLISRRTACQLLANDFDIEDVDAELAAIEEENTPAAPLEESPPARGPGGGQATVTDETQAFPAEEIDRLEEQAQKIAARYFRRVRRRFLERLKEQGITDAAREEPLVDNRLEDQVLQLLEEILVQEADGLLADLTPIYQKGANLGGGYAYAQLGLDFELLREDTFNRLLFEAGRRIKGINDTTLGQVRQALAEGYAAGEGWERIAARLDRVFDTAHSVRSELIARTEPMWAFNETAKSIYRDAGVEKVRWDATSDMRTCSVCASRDGKVYDLDEAPPCPHHPRCRCTLLPVF